MYSGSFKITGDKLELELEGEYDDDETGGVGAMGFTPSYVIDPEYIQNGAALVGRSEGTEVTPPRGTLDLSKAYLYSAASHHQVVRAGDLTNVWRVTGVLRSNCNAGSTYTNEKGYLGDLEMWLNKGVIANLIFFPLLEHDG